MGKCDDQQPLSAVLSPTKPLSEERPRTDQRPPDSLFRVASVYREQRLIFLKPIKMLKYQVRSRASSSLLSPSSSGSLNDTTLTSRSSSMMSLNSVDSASSTEGDWGTLKVYTQNIRAGTDYKTLRLSSQMTVGYIIDTMLNKFKLSCRDANLFELRMEVTTKAPGSPFVVTTLRLSRDARPLELQRCHPLNMSRFILHMKSAGTLVRIHDHNICPESNYKSLLLSAETIASETVSLVLGMCRKEGDGSSYGLFLTSPKGEAQIPDELPVVAVARRCLPHHKIVIRQVDSL